MPLRAALKEQYHAGLAMLACCIDQCPVDLWTTAFPCPQDPDRTIFRSFERIAFHAIYFTHLYLGQSEAAFQPPPEPLAVRKRPENRGMWHAPWEVEPYELPPGSAHSPAELGEYLAFLRMLIDPTVDALDLEAADTGISWYPNMGKLSHQMLNVRHLQGHVGQLSELLMARNVDVPWISRSSG